MSSGRSNHFKHDPLKLAAKGCARVDVIEKAVCGAALPDIAKAERLGKDEIALALDELYKTKGVAMSRAQYKAYLKLIAKEN